MCISSKDFIAIYGCKLHKNRTTILRFLPMCLHKLQAFSELKYIFPLKTAINPYDVSKEHSAKQQSISSRKKLDYASPVFFNCKYCLDSHNILFSPKVTHGTNGQKRKSKAQRWPKLWLPVLSAQWHMIVNIDSSVLSYKKRIVDSWRSFDANTFDHFTFDQTKHLQIQFHVFHVNTLRRNNNSMTLKIT